MPAVAAPGEIGTAVPRHDDHQEEQNPLDAVRKAPEQDQVAEQQRYIEEPHEEHGGLSGRLPDLPDPEEEDKKGEENQNRKGKKEEQLIAVKKNERQQRSGEGSGHPLHPPFGKGHPVELDEAQKGNDQDEAGKEKKAPLENQQDEERQGDCRRQHSLLNGQLLSDGLPRFSPSAGNHHGPAVAVSLLCAVDRWYAQNAAPGPDNRTVPDAARRY